MRTQGIAVIVVLASSNVAFAQSCGGKGGCNTGPMVIDVARLRAIASLAHSMPYTGVENHLFFLHADGLPDPRATFSITRRAKEACDE